MKKEEHKIAYKFLKYTLGVLFQILYHPKYVNKEYIPKEGPIIVCGNHRHLLDQCLPCLATKRMLHYLAKKEFFDNKKVAWFFKSAGCISVDRKNHDSDAKEKALEVLKNNYALGIFPEGTRNKTFGTKDEVDLLPFKMGTVSFAQKTGAYIVPFAITGEYKMFRNKLIITFLKPFKVKPDDDLEKVNDKLRNMILEEYQKHKKD